MPVALTPPPGVPSPPVVIDPDIVEAYLTDASGMPPGSACGVVRPTSEQEAAAALRDAARDRRRVLFQAARSSLTAGAVPHGELVLSVERMRGIGALEPAGDDGACRVRVRPGERLVDLQRELAARGAYFPPVPTYQEAMVGGVLSTNAGGAATFKYGVTRDWVHGLRVLLHDGRALAIERGQALARPGERFVVRDVDGSPLEVPAPLHTLPTLKKVSAGYRGADPLDLVDLFVGSEGTLGLIVEATLDLVSLPAATLAALVLLPTREGMLSLAGELRRLAHEARRSERGGVDVRSIEWLDERCLALLREAGVDRRLRVDLPPGLEHALLLEAELPRVVERDEVEAALLRAASAGGGVQAGPLDALFGELARRDLLASTQVAMPGDDARRAALFALREAAPQQVNERLAERRRGDPRVRKVGGDLIVPVERLAGMIDVYREGFERRGLDYAIWGHLSDGNLHPNALARDAAEVEAGEQALLEFADEAIRRGGCPLSEHGVGRSPLKQAMLRRFVGEPAIAGMRATKRALDPDWRLAPGVLFPENPGPTG